MITCKNLKKAFDQIIAVDDINITIDSGRFIGLLGPNGAGKTTLIKLMIGLLDPQEGEIEFEDQLMSKDAIQLKKNIGVVSQHINLDKELTVEENLIFAGKLYHMKKKEINNRLEVLLDLLDLQKKRKSTTKKLSGGMKRKLMIAKALMHEPKYLFLDEPTVGVDVNARKEIWRFLRAYHQSGNTVLLTTHYIEEAEQLCDYVMLINEGKIFKENTAEELIKEIGSYKVEYHHKMFYYSSLEEAKEATASYNDIFKIDKTTLEDLFYHFTNGQVLEWK